MGRILREAADNALTNATLDEALSRRQDDKDR